MKIRTLLVTIFVLTLATSGLAQNRAWRAAEDAFSSMQYNLALTKYKKALTKARTKPDKEKISFQMAECYRLINNTKKAEAAYKRIAKTKIKQYRNLKNTCIRGKKSTVRSHFYEER